MDALRRFDRANALTALGRHREAEEQLLHAEETLAAIGSWLATMVALARAQLLYQTERTEAADRLFDEAASRIDPRVILIVGHAALLRLVRTAVGEGFDEAVAAVAAGVHGALQRDLGTCLVLAERRARSGGRADRADRIVALGQEGR